MPGQTLPVGNFTFRERLITLTATASLIAAANPQRVYLGFATVALGSGALSTKPGVTLSSGMQLPAVGVIIDLFWNRHGTMVTSDWYGVSGAGSGLLVFETILL